MSVCGHQSGWDSADDRDGVVWLLYLLGGPTAIYWSEEMFRIWDFDPQQGVPDSEEAWQRVHREDIKRIREALVFGGAALEE